jgi:hypothetical protein
LSSNAEHDDHGGGDEPPEHGGDCHDGHDDLKAIEIIVVTTADDLDREFKLKEPLRDVFDRALKLVGGHRDADQFTLEYHDEPLTQLDRRIGDIARELGWRKRVELELVPKPVVV